MAAIIDGIVFLPTVLMQDWVFKTTQQPAVIVVYLILNAFAPIIYSVVLHYKYGQTLGKWVVGIKVIDRNEVSSISLKQAFLRDIFYILTEVTGLIYFLFILSQASDVIYLFNDYQDFLNTPLFIWTLLQLITMLMNSKRRAIHDFIANTVVVRA